MLEQFRNLNKKYFILVGLVAALCYGFTLTNHSMGIDDEAFNGYFYGNSLLSQGRWGYLILKNTFNSYEFLPFWRDLMAVLLIILGLTLFNLIFKKFSNNTWNDKMSIIFTCISISFPYIASLFVFMMTTIEYGFVLTLSALSIYFYFLWDFEKKHWVNVIYSILILTLAIAFSESSPVYFLSAFFMVLLLKCINNDCCIKFRTFMLSVIKMASVVFLSIVSWKVIGRLLQVMLHVGHLDYVNNYIQYNFSGVLPFFASLKYFIFCYVKNILFNLKSDYASALVSTMTIIMIIFTLVFSIRYKKLVVFLCGVCLLTSAHILPVITGNSNLPHRTVTSFSIFIGFSFCLLYFIFKDIHIKRLHIGSIAILFAVLVVFYQSKQMNEYFFVDYKSYQHDVLTMAQIDHDIKVISNNNKIIFIGVPKEFNQVLEPTIGNSLFNWDREYTLDLELASWRLYPFFQQHGYDIVPPHSYVVETLKEQSKNMTIWPKQGSIKECSEYVIINLGDSHFKEVGTE